MSRQEFVSAKAQFRSRYRMFSDYYQTVTDSEGSIASSVAFKLFTKYMPEFIAAYETLLRCEDMFESEADFTLIQDQFSEINRVSVKMQAHHMEGTMAPQVVPEEASGAQVKAKLPFIELPKFSGDLLEWVSFYDLFMSLVHHRQSLSDSEKHYYLRASVSGEALSVIRHLPMDGANYEVGLGLLRQRYNNVRMLTDSYLGRIMGLPVVTDSTDLRRDFYDPLRESTQALAKLGLPVTEWSYLLVFTISQKLPSKIRTAYEERHGREPEKLPTFNQLMELLDEQCRLQFTVQDQD